MKVILIIPILLALAILPLILVGVILTYAKVLGIEKTVLDLQRRGEPVET